MGKTSFKKYTEIYRICGASLMAQSKESACNEGDLGSVPGLGRCPGEGNGYPLQYSFFFFLIIHVFIWMTQILVSAGGV